MRALRATVVACLGGLLLAAPAAGVAQSSQRSLPNLVPRPPGIQLGNADPRTGERAIRLQTPMANAGDAHLDLLGIADDVNKPRSRAFQCVVWAHDRVCSERVEVGYFLWHPAHGHHHFQDFALYELRRLHAGRPDMTKQGLVAGGDKVSFCLIDTDRDDGEPPGNDWMFGWPLYTSCAAGTGYQGISRGWADTYTYARVDQQIVIDDVPPGTYALVVTVDPEDLVFETSDGDNTVALKIRLTDRTVEEVCVFDRRLSRCLPE